MKNRPLLASLLLRTPRPPPTRRARPLPTVSENPQTPSASGTGNTCPARTICLATRAQPPADPVHKTLTRQYLIARTLIKINSSPWVDDLRRNPRTALARRRGRGGRRLGRAGSGRPDSNRRHPPPHAGAPTGRSPSKRRAFERTRRVPVESFRTTCKQTKHAVIRIAHTEITKNNQIYSPGDADERLQRQGFIPAAECEFVWTDKVHVVRQCPRGLHGAGGHPTGG